MAKKTKSIKSVEPVEVIKPIKKVKVEFDTVPTEEEHKNLLLKEDLESIQVLYWAGKHEEAEVLLTEKLKSHFNINLLDLRDRVAAYVKDNASELALSIAYIVPSGDWSKCLNDDESKQKFLEEEASKSDQWKIQSLGRSNLPKVWTITFKMPTMETDDAFLGYAWVSETGKVKHVFAQAE